MSAITARFDVDRLAESGGLPDNHANISGFKNWAKSHYLKLHGQNSRNSYEINTIIDKVRPVTN